MRWLEVRCCFWELQGEVSEPWRSEASLLRVYEGDVPSLSGRILLRVKAVVVARTTVGVVDQVVKVAVVVQVVGGISDLVVTMGTDQAAVGMVPLKGGAVVASQHMAVMAADQAAVAGITVRMVG